MVSIENSLIKLEFEHYFLYTCNINSPALKKRTRDPPKKRDVTQDDGVFFLNTQLEILEKKAKKKKKIFSLLIDDNLNACFGVM